MGSSSPISHEVSVALNASLLGTLCQKVPGLPIWWFYLFNTAEGLPRPFPHNKVVDHLNFYQHWQFQFRNLERDLAFSEIISNL